MNLSDRLRDILQKVWSAARDGQNVEAELAGIQASLQRENRVLILVVFFLLLPAPVIAQDDPNPAVTVTGDVAGGVRQRVDQALRELPPPVREAVKNFGWQILIGPTVSSVCATKPQIVDSINTRGEYITGATATGRLRQRLIVIAALTLVPRTNPLRFAPNARVEYLTKYGIGEAYEYATDHPEASSDFLAAFNEDVGHFNSQQRAHLNYYMDGGTQPQIYAIGFAAAYSPPAEVSDWEVEQLSAFPRVRRFLLRTLPDVPPGSALARL